jgi:hypothetical protein
VYTTASSSPKELAVRIGSTVDAPLGALQGEAISAGVFAPQPVPVGDPGYTQTVSGTVVGAIFGSALSASTAYYFYRPMSGTASTAFTNVATDLGTVPRGSWSYSDDTDGRTLYLDGSTPISSSIFAATLKGTDVIAGDFSFTVNVTSVDPSARTITFFTSAATRLPVYSFAGSGAPEVRFGLGLHDWTVPTGASIADVLDYVAANAQQFQTVGVFPGLRTEDFDSSTWHDVFDSLPAYNSGRWFSTFSATSLADVVREELKAACCFPAVDATGRLIPARLRLAAQSEVAATATIDAPTRLLTDKQRVSREPSGLGQVNQIEIKTGFNAVSGDFDGTTFDPRDNVAFGQSPETRLMPIAQKSEFFGAFGPNEALAMAAPIFGALAGAYSIDTIDAAKSDAVQVGDPIVFDNPYLVSPTGTSAGGTPTSTRGVTGRVGIVLGKEWGAFSPRVRFTVLNSTEQYGGYAPAGFVTAQTNTSGNTWSITLATTYLPSGTDWTDFLYTGEPVAVVKWNASSGRVSGTVVSVSATGAVITFGSVWTPGADTWYVTLQESTAIASTDAAAKFGFAGNGDATLDFSDVSIGAKVFAP